MGDKPVTLRSFFKDLRWFLPAVLATMLVIYLLDLEGARDVGLVPMLLFGVGFVVVLGPLSWLRWNHWGGHSKAHWRFLGLSMLWGLVSLAVIVLVVLPAFGVD